MFYFIMIMWDLPQKGEFMIFSDSSFNFTEKIGQGALLSVSLPNGKVNTMTVSWGQAGVLWNKDVCTVYVRPQRYTFEFCENAEIFTLSFLKKEEKSTLTFCGTKSGRDFDKFKECNLKYEIKNGACILENAEVTLVLKKLYAQDLKKDCFENEAPLSNYQNNDFHRAYTCEVIEIIK